jgi:hypothetical protein
MWRENGKMHFVSITESLVQLLVCNMSVHFIPTLALIPWLLCASISSSHSNQTHV